MELSTHSARIHAQSTGRNSTLRQEAVPTPHPLPRLEPRAPISRLPQPSTVITLGSYASKAPCELNDDADRTSKHLEISHSRTRIRDGVGERVSPCIVWLFGVDVGDGKRDEEMRREGMP